MELRTEIVVLGAGAAGLAAARILSQAGVAAVVLEARERIGGRLFTREDVGLPVPVELGGEFIHGTAPVSFALLRAAHRVALDVTGESFTYENGALRLDNEERFAIVARVMRRAGDLADDVSAETFLRGLGDGPDVERERKYTRLFIQGFDAADPHRASARALAEEWNGGEEGQTARTFRPLGGYGHLLRTLHGTLDPERVQVRLATEAHVLRRDANGVVVEATTAGGTPVHVRARAAIVTLPVGVLSAGALRFEPALPPEKADALAHILTGPVVKLVLQFRTAFWERLDGERYRDAGFFLRPEAAFPTFWTLIPQRTPLLMAWAGGPKAAALANHDQTALVATALNDLSTLFGNAREPHDELEAAYAHDWQRDPYARGAYSYLATGGTGARETLAAPVDDVLFFAGEATSPTAEAGTAAGALQSGERAAREALDARALHRSFT